MTTPSASELVTLRGGVTVPVSALTLLLDLERRGFEVWVSADTGQLLVKPASRLRPGDKLAIVTHRRPLCDLVRYCEAIY